MCQEWDLKTWPMWFDVVLFLWLGHKKTTRRRCLPGLNFVISWGLGWSRRSVGFCWFETGPKIDNQMSYQRSWKHDLNMNSVRVPRWARRVFLWCFLKFDIARWMEGHSYLNFSSFAGWFAIYHAQEPLGWAKQNCFVALWTFLRRRHWELGWTLTKIVNFKKTRILKSTSWWWCSCRSELWDGYKRTPVMLGLITNQTPEDWYSIWSLFVLDLGSNVELQKRKFDQWVSVSAKGWHHLQIALSLLRHATGVENAHHRGPDSNGLDQKAWPPSVPTKRGQRSWSKGTKKYGARDYHMPTHISILMSICTVYCTYMTMFFPEKKHQ